METLLHALPYDVSAAGFYFKSADEYNAKSKRLKNAFGDRVEEFEIQFIEGEAMDDELAKAMDLSQSNLARFFELVDEWEEYQKMKFIIAVGEYGCNFDIDKDDPDLLDVDIYDEGSMKDLAIRFVEDGLFGDIPDHLQYYVDYDAMARDLAVDYSQSCIAGNALIYRCG